MDLNNILDSIYLIPVILDHLDRPTETTTKIILENGITKEDLEECDKVKELLIYHYKIIATGFNPNYTQLRYGLHQYFNHHLSPMFQKLGMIDKNWNVLDYGCGEGQVLEQFLKDNPESNGILVDREWFSNRDKPLYFDQVDWEKNPDWFYGYLNAFHLVILSEVLHCKDYKGQDYLLKSSEAMLKKQGRLLIVENVDYCMEYRISKIKQGSYKVLNEWHIRELMEGRNFRLINILKINRHKIYEYQKI